MMPTSYQGLSCKRGRPRRGAASTTAQCLRSTKAQRLHAVQANPGVLCKQIPACCVILLLRVLCVPSSCAVCAFFACAVCAFFVCCVCLLRVRCV